MSKAKARVFVPLTKVDEEQRLVYGTITQEVLDKSGEVMDYDTSKPFFEKWSSEIEQASGGLSKGNLRVMHGLQVAGKLTDLAFDDENKSIEVCAKVVDDAEWAKVTEGCYTGFSVGGKYEKRWTDNGVKKYTAGPNEVSLVDNPCVPTASFALIKADGAEEQVLFKAASEDSPVKDDVSSDPPVETQEPVQTELPFTNDDVVSKATEIAKAANDGTTWMDHVATARDQLVKAHQEQTDEGGEKIEDVPTTEGTEDTTANDAPAEGTVEKVTPPGVKQVWAASDGKTFEKKADCEAHEATLTKAAVEPTEAEKLATRLNKAISDEPAPEPEVGLMEDFDRLSKVTAALITPFGEDGKPVLEKGMYTINRFSNVLSDMAALSRCIKNEGVREGGDNDDSSVSADIISAVKTLGKTFIDYASEQVTELLAGMDDDVVVTYYDYYYNAAQTDPENGLAKDVCAVINDLRDPSREKREVLGKAFGFTAEVPEQSDTELSPALQKRFDDLTAENESFKKVATEAVEKVEELAKQVKELADQPMPRAPVDGHIAFRGGDVEFMGKRFSNEQDLRAELHNMIKTMGPDALAVEMIKASQAGGGQRLTVTR